MAEAKKIKGSFQKLGWLGTGLVALSIVAAACSSNNASSPTTTKAGSTTQAGGSGQNVTSELQSLEKPPTGSVALQETGSTLLFPLFQLWAPAYNSAYSNISVTPAGTGSGTGIAQAAAGAVQIGASDAYLSSFQVTKYPGLLNIPVAISAQQINYNIPNFTGKLQLNGSVLSAIYQGKITNWNNSKIAAINPGVKLPNLPIVPLHRSDGSGDTFLFTQYLSKSDANGWGNNYSYNTTWTGPAISSALAENGNGGMVSGCKATPGCIAYIGISFLDQTNADGLGEAYVANASGKYMQPDASNIEAEVNSLVGQTPANQAMSLIYGPDAGGYPIVNYEYAIVSSNQSDANTAKAVAAFLAWCMDPANGGQTSYLSKVHFEPLPSQALSQAVTQLKQIH
ncbi:MAG: phosphate ABC transporter substrate-binding protein PstS [Acidimicrobiales bacterium]|nr:phosphate ABC transporter substrate-binding protein PstS [Acidimicrobiales bacterium]